MSSNWLLSVRVQNVRGDHLVVVVDIWFEQGLKYDELDCPMQSLWEKGSCKAWDSEWEVIIVVVGFRIDEADEVIFFSDFGLSGLKRF